MFLKFALVALITAALAAPAFGLFELPDWARVLFAVAASTALLVGVGMAAQ